MGCLRQHVRTGAPVLQSAMPRNEQPMAGHRLLADRGDDESRLRRTVIAGPGGSVQGGDTLLRGGLTTVAGPARDTPGLGRAGPTRRLWRLRARLREVTSARRA